MVFYTSVWPLFLRRCKWLAHAVFALPGRGAAPPHRRAPLPPAQMQPLDTRRVARPAAGGHDLRHRHGRAAHHAVVDLPQAPPSPALAPLCQEPLGQGPPVGLGRRPWGRAPHRLHPGSTMGHQSRQRMRVASAQKERPPAGRSPCGAVMAPGWRPGAGACPHLHAQPPWALGRAPLHGLGCPAVPGAPGPQHRGAGIELDRGAL
jgi:hypothetical protein